MYKDENGPAVSMQVTENSSTVVSTLANIRLSGWKIWHRLILSAVIFQFVNPEITR